MMATWQWHTEAIDSQVELTHGEAVALHDHNVGAAAQHDVQLTGEIAASRQHIVVFGATRRTSDGCVKGYGAQISALIGIVTSKSSCGRGC